MSPASVLQAFNFVELLFSAYVGFALLAFIAWLVAVLVSGPRRRRRPLSLETTGDPRSANSAAPQGCVGQGMGGTPMSTDVQPVPVEVAHALSTTAQGIVTRMGQDLQGLGCEAIEPGPAGMRPACTSCAAACTADLCASARGRSAGAGAGAGQAPTIPDGNHGDNQKEATE